MDKFWIVNLNNLCYGLYIETQMVMEDNGIYVIQKDQVRVSDEQFEEFKKLPSAKIFIKGHPYTVIAKFWTYRDAINYMYDLIEKPNKTDYTELQVLFNKIILEK